MLAKRIIPCLDVKDGKVVKGVQFKNHQIVGEVLELAAHYSEAGADELVFYDITASADQRVVSREWVKNIAQQLDIPFCVAGGIRTLAEAEAVLNAGADKISVNSPALENPAFIDELVDVFGQQCIVIGIDSILLDGDYRVCQYTGDEKKMIQTPRLTEEWLCEVQERGAGEIVLNCMNQDGMRQGYDIAQLKKMRTVTHVPLVASGGAGSKDDFVAVFQQTSVDAALAASVFHTGSILMPELKTFLRTQQIEIRV
jgi:cyclase